MFELLGRAGRLLWPGSVAVVDVADDAEGAPPAPVVRLGLVGASNIAKFAAVNAASRRRDVVVHAVASRAQAKAAAFAAKHGIPVVHATVADLLADPAVDAVYVSVPSELHFEFGMSALAAGKHVLLEKPMTVTAAESRMLRDAARERGLVLMEAMHYRHHPIAKRAKEVLALGELGEVVGISAHFAMFDARSRSWSLDWSEEKLATKMLDRYVYCVDIIRLLCGDDEADVHEVRSADVSAGGFVVDASVTLSNGVQATLVADSKSLTVFPTWGAKVVCEKGSLELTNFITFPNVYHALKVSPADGPCRVEKRYANGETTFEFQLGAFASAIGNCDGNDVGAVGAEGAEDAEGAVGAAGGAGSADNAARNLDFVQQLRDSFSPLS